jgi:membrane-associated phospholipid phosphatase
MDVVVWLQESASWLTPGMLAVTHLGDEEFYLLAFPLLYWCANPRLGVRLGVILLLSSGINATLKLVTATPRPYWVDGEVVAGATEPTFGAPSGHAQNGVAFWGLLAHGAGRRWAWPLAGLLVVVLGVSRVHLGAHFPLDVVAGWAVGVVLLVAYLRLERPVTVWLAGLRPLAQCGVAVAGGAGLVAAGAVVLAARGAFEVPAAWVQGAAAAGQGELAPLVLGGVATPAGALTGLGLGLVVLRTCGGFAVAAAPWRVLARYPIGLAGVLALWTGLDALFPDGHDAFAVAARFVHYAAVGVWISGVAPLVFVRMRLAMPASLGGDIPEEQRPGSR